MERGGRQGIKNRIRFLGYWKGGLDVVGFWVGGRWLGLFPLLEDEEGVYVLLGRRELRRE
jgi:hypothetical protein